MSPHSPLSQLPHQLPSLAQCSHATRARPAYCVTTSVRLLGRISHSRGFNESLFHDYFHVFFFVFFIHMILPICQR